MSRHMYPPLALIMTVIKVKELQVVVALDKGAGGVGG